MHPTYQYTFDDLYRGLLEHVDAGWIDMKELGSLRLFNYNRKCTYEKYWNNFTLSARGLILDVDNKCIAATTLPKFFNHGEVSVALPEGPFDVYTKYDGSLGICYFYQDQWHVATRGSFNSDQAIWATTYLRSNPNPQMQTDTTYLVEIIYATNRIVVDYKGWEGLVFLAAYRNGQEISYDDLTAVATAPYKVATKHHYTSLDDILELCKQLPTNEEGFVVKFADNTRIKIKGSEYIRLHRLISNVTPLDVWESLISDDDVDKIKVELPEEFLADYEQIVCVLRNKGHALLQSAKDALSQTLLEVGDNRKDVALYIKKWFDSRIHSAVFQLHSGLPEKTIQKNILRGLRPTGNKLEGYAATSAMSRFSSIEEG